jgi:hypothetical protein
VSLEGRGGGSWALAISSLHLHHSLSRQFFCDFVQGDELQGDEVGFEILTVSHFIKYESI